MPQRRPKRVDGPRPGTKVDDYWGVYWDITKAAKERFDAAGISIPFPQRDVHLYQQAVPA